jgi:hypothetical protein
MAKSVKQRWPQALEAREPAPLTHLQQRIIAKIGTLEAQHAVSDIYPRDFKRLSPQWDLTDTCALVHYQEEGIAASAHAWEHLFAFYPLCTTAHYASKTQNPPA